MSPHSVFHPLYVLLSFLLLFPSYPYPLHAVNLPTISIVQPNFTFPSLLARHDLLFNFSFNESTDQWTTLPTNWLTGPFFGNGLIGTIIYFCDPPVSGTVQRKDNGTSRGGSGGYGRGAYCEGGNSTNVTEMRIEFGRQDLYSARQPLYHFWNGVRLPVGYLRIRTKGYIREGSLRLNLYEAKLQGTLITTLGTVSVTHYVHALEPGIILNVNPSGGESGPDFPLPVLVPLSQCVNRIDVYGLINCTLFPNPDQVCLTTTSTTNTTIDTTATEETVCTQTMLSTDEGTFATAMEIVMDTTTGNGAYTLYATIQSAMWPYNTAANATDMAIVMARQLSSIGEATLSVSHLQWWNTSFWSRSMLSLPDTKTESFYFIEMYKMGSSMRENGPVRDEIGPWYVDTEWPTLWLDLNLELTYWPVAASNRYEGGRSLGNGIKMNIDNGHLNANARRSWPQLSNASDALNIGASSNQMAVGGDLGDLAWVTHDIWLQCQYEYNATCFLEYLLPPLRGAMGAYRYLLSYNLNGTITDQLHLFPTDSPAGYPSAPGYDCSYDIGAVRWGFATILEVCNASIYGLPPFDNPVYPVPSQCDKEFLTDAVRIIQDITPISIDPVRGINVWGSRDGQPVPFDIPFRHFSHLLAFVDYLIIAPEEGIQNYTTVTRNNYGYIYNDTVCVNTVDNFYNVTFPGNAASTFSYPAVAQMNAYLGRGNPAYGNVTAVLYSTDFVHMTSITPVTMDNEGSSNIGNGSDVVNITPESTMALTDVLHKILLQSHHEILRVFKAVPDSFVFVNNTTNENKEQIRVRRTNTTDESDAVFWRLRGERAFLVSAQRTQGVTQWVQIESEAGAQPVILATNFGPIVNQNISALVWKTYPENLNITVSIIPSNTTTDHRTTKGIMVTYFRIEGLTAGSTVLLWSTMSGKNNDNNYGPPRISVTPIPSLPGCENQWGWSPLYQEGPCS